MNDAKQLYNLLGGKYLSSMYTDNYWTSFVDQKEKMVVSRIWQLSTTSDLKKEKILDLGCGPGRWSKFFIEQGFHDVCGLDVAVNMVNFARRTIHRKNFTAVVGNIEQLPFPDQSFDKIFCFRAFKYVKHYNQAIKEISRVLKPKGTLLLEVSNKSLLNIFFKKVSLIMIHACKGISLESRWRYFLRANFYSKSDIVRLAESGGLQVVSATPVFVLPSIPLPVRVKNLTRVWGILDSVLFTSLPKKWFARSWIFVIAKNESKK